MKWNNFDIVASTNYFGLTDDELLEEWNDHGYTREECKLFDDGLNITFFDDLEELQEEESNFLQWLESQRYEIKSVVETVNGRIAVVSI